MNLTRYLLQELKQFGVECLYGIPGDFVLPLFEGIQREAILPLVYLGHEPSAVFAADAHARMANTPSTVIMTYGAGALNGVNAVAQAYVELVPLIVLAGYPAQSEIDRGLLIHHQAKTVDSQRKVYEEITCCQVRLDNPLTAAAELRRAMVACVTQSQPVLVEFPRDAVNFVTPPLPALQPASLCSAQLKETADTLWQRLCHARRPVILSGVAMRRFDAVNALQEFAGRAQIPLLSTLMGRACLDTSHPSYAGIFLDKSDDQPAQLLADADLIVLAGVIRSDTNFAAHGDLFPNHKVVELQQGQQRITDRVINGLPLKALFEALTQRVDHPFATVSLVKPVPSLPADPGELLSAASVVDELHRVLSQKPMTVPIISDVGDCLFASLQSNPRYLLAPAFYASMGYAVPAAFGVQSATGLRPVVLVGDGAFQMTGMELGHCRRYGFAPIVVLFNNQRWDMIRAFAPELECTDLGQWDYRQLAQAMGGQGWTVETHGELCAALLQAFACEQQFTLIDARLCPASRTARLDRFARNFLSAGEPARAEPVPDA